MKSKHKSFLKKILYFSVILFFCWVIFQNIDDFKTLYKTVFNANFIYLGYVVLVGLGNQAIYSLIYRKAFKTVIKVDRYPKLLSNTIISNFLTISNPLGVTGASAYLLAYFVKRGISKIKILFGMMTVSLSISLSYLPVLAVTVIYLYNTHILTGYQEFAIKTLLILNLGLILLYCFLLATPSKNARLAKAITRYMNSILEKIVKKRPISEELIISYEKEVKYISKRFDKSIFKFLRYLPISIGYHGINILVLYLSYLAFDIVSPIQQVLTVYGIIYLFTVISPTPQGIGIVEGLAHTTAISIGLPSSPSLMAILIYRFGTLWIPAILGMILMKKDSESI